LFPIHHRALILKGSMKYRLIGLSFVAGLALVLAGCGGGKYQPVSGQVVTPDGSPVTGLDGGTIVFETTNEAGEPLSASGAIDAEGKFTLGTETVNDGAAAGKHKVLITPPAATGDVPPPPVIDPKYQSFETSGLEIEVKEGSNDLKVPVEPAAK
jgi:hypothetical protein